jgi:hypothetical protein
MMAPMPSQFVGPGAKRPWSFPVGTEVVEG